jgi:hypothetical protein
MSGVTLDGALLHDVILIRHGAPIHDSERPATEWTLSAEGEYKARDLGDSLVAAGIRQLVSSPEPKAVAAALERHSSRRPVGVVTDGTVTTAFLAANGLVKADSFWSGLTMPDAWQCMSGSLMRFPNNM